MLYLIIQDETVINVVEWDGHSDWAPQEGCTVESRTGDEWIGWERVAGTWQHAIVEFQE